MGNVNATFAEWLESEDACDEAREWCDARTVEEAWAECPRADWMLWLVCHLGLEGFWCADLARLFAADALEAAEARAHAVERELEAAKTAAATAAMNEPFRKSLRPLVTCSTSVGVRKFSGAFWIRPGFWRPSGVSIGVSSSCFAIATPCAHRKLIK